MDHSSLHSHSNVLTSFVLLCLAIGGLASCSPSVRPAPAILTATVRPTAVQPLPTPTAQETAAETGQITCETVQGKFEQSCASASTGLKYWLYLPPEPTEAKARRLPLLIYLHGFNHSGSDLNRLLAGGLPSQIENKRSLPMIVVSPQCPSGENWQTDSMVERLSLLVTEVTSQYGADPQRVYLTGFSMGGDGVWALGIAHPEQFAALAPVGSWYRNEKAVCALKNVPVWDFQGEQDQIVSSDYAKKMVAALQQCGGAVRLTLFPATDHEGSSRQAYGMDELYAWLLDQKIK